MHQTYQNTTKHNQPTQNIPIPTEDTREQVQPNARIQKTPVDRTRNIPTKQEQYNQYGPKVSTTIPETDTQITRCEAGFLPRIARFCVFIIIIIII